MPSDVPPTQHPRRVVRYETTDSTNERALAAVADGSARHGDWHVATAQTAGRGRRGNAWSSVAGEGLYATLVLLPGTLSSGPDPELARLPAALTMAAGLGVVDAVRALGLEGVRLKWPNDVVVGRAKLAGLLVEARGLDPARPHFVVGLGLNVRQQEFPPELLAERAVTSLALEGLELEVEAAFTALAPRLEARLEAALAPAADLEALAAAFTDATGLLGTRVAVHAGGDVATGRLEGLSFARGVELALDAGGRRHVPLAHAARVVPATRG